MIAATLERRWKRYTLPAEGVVVAVTGYLGPLAIHVGASQPVVVDFHGPERVAHIALQVGERETLHRSEEGDSLFLCALGDECEATVWGATELSGA